MVVENKKLFRFDPLDWRNLPKVWRYGLSAASIAVLVVIAYFLQPYVFLTPLFFLSIMISTWAGGIGPGLLAVLLSTLSIFFVFDFQGDNYYQNVPRLIAFLLTALLVGVWNAGRRRAEYGLQQSHDEPEIKVQHRVGQPNENNQHLQKEIAERRQAEDALHEYKELLRVLAENASDYVRLNDIEGRVLYASSSVERLHGRLPASVFEVAHPDDLEPCREWWEKVVAGTAKNLQWRVLDKEGNYQWMESSASFFSYKSQPHVLTVCRNITERKRVREALQENEYKLREAQRIAKLGYWEWDFIDNRIIISEETRCLFEQQQCELSQAELKKVIHPDDWQFYIKSLNKALRGEQSYNIEFRIVRPNGDVRFIYVWDEIVYDESGSPVRMFGTVQDVTERKQAEEKLQQVERELRLLIDTIPVNVWRANTDGAIDFTNRRLLKDSGFSQEDLEGWNWMKFIHPEDVTEFLSRWEAALASGKPMEMETRVLQDDGRYDWFLVLNVPFRDKKGNIIHWYGTSVDITTRKLAENQLKDFNKKLRALSAKLQSAREEEGRRIALEMHDELGSTLTTLKWNLEEMHIALSDVINIPQVSLLRKKLDAMMILTNSLIQSVKRISSELRPPILDDLGLAAAVEWQARQFQERTGIVCDCDCALENLELNQEQSTAIFRILQEALTNVLRHAQATKVDISLKKKSEELVMSVRDNGRGITEEEKFKPSAFGILGMRERAYLLGGKVEINGVKDQGTVVTVRIPLNFVAQNMTKK